MATEYQNSLLRAFIGEEDLATPSSFESIGTTPRENRAESVGLSTQSLTTLPGPHKYKDIWLQGVEGGMQQLTADFWRMGGLTSLLLDKPDKVDRRLGRADLLTESSGRLLGSIEPFEKFLDEPTVDGFLTQFLKGVGQVTPMALSSLAMAFGGWAVGMVGKGVLSVSSQAVSRKLMKDLVQKSVQAKRGLGPSLDATEQSILNAAYAAVRRIKYPKDKLGRTYNRIDGKYAEQTVRYPELFKYKGKDLPSRALDFPFGATGFWAGAGAQEYIVGSSQSLHEFQEAGFELTKEEAKAAAALGIPQALIGTLGEYIGAKALFKLAAGDFVATGSASVGKYMQEFAKGLGQGLFIGGVTEGTAEYLQEELFLQQRFGIEPEYSPRQANLRRAESAFVGFWAGAGRQAPTSAIARVIGRSRAESGEIERQRADNNEAYTRGGVGIALPEPIEDLAAQIKAMLTEGVERNAVWVEFPENATREQMHKTLGNIRQEAARLLNIEDDELQARLDIQIQPDGSGAFIVDNTNQQGLELFKEGKAQGFSDEFLQRALGIFELQTPEMAVGIRVTDEEGKVIHTQAVSDENAQAAFAKAEKDYPAEKGYTVRQMSKQEIAEDRQAGILQEEDVFGDEVQRQREESAIKDLEREAEERAKAVREQQAKERPITVEEPQPQQQGQQEFDFSDLFVEQESKKEAEKQAAILSRLEIEKLNEYFDKQDSLEKGIGDNYDNYFSSQPGSGSIATILKDYNAIRQGEEAEFGNVIVYTNAYGVDTSIGISTVERILNAPPSERVIKKVNEFKEDMFEIPEGQIEQEIKKETAAQQRDTAREGGDILSEVGEREETVVKEPTLKKQQVGTQQTIEQTRAEQPDKTYEPAPETYTMDNTKGLPEQDFRKWVEGRKEIKNMFLNTLPEDEAKLYWKNTGRIDLLTNELLNDYFKLTSSVEGGKDIYRVVQRPDGKFVIVEQDQGRAERETRSRLLDEVKLAAKIHKSEKARQAHGWSITDPTGQKRFVYLPRLVQWGQHLNRITGDVGYVEGSKEFATAGFDTLIHELLDAGYTLEYKGKPIDAAAMEEGVIYTKLQGKTIKSYSYRDIEEGRVRASQPIPPDMIPIKARIEVLEQEISDLVEYHFRQGGKEKRFPQTPEIREKQEELTELYRTLNEGWQEQPAISQVATPVELGVNRASGTLEGLGYTFPEGSPVQPKETKAGNQGVSLRIGGAEDHLINRINLETEPEFNLPNRLDKPKSKRRLDKVIYNTADESVKDFFGGLWPVLRNIIRGRPFKYNRHLRITTPYDILSGTFGKTVNLDRMVDIYDQDNNLIKRNLKELVEEEAQVIIDGPDYIRSITELLGKPRRRTMGTRMKFGDTDIIVLNIDPAKPITNIELAEMTMVLGHEMGHLLYDQHADALFNNINLLKKMKLAFEEAKRRTGEPQYQGPRGFTEWYADQMAIWLIKKTGLGSINLKNKPRKGKNFMVENHFFNLAKKIRGLFTELAKTMKVRFKQDIVFEEYVAEIEELALNENPKNTLGQKVEVDYMIAELSENFSSFLTKPQMQKLVKETKSILGELRTLLPTHKKHWTVERFILPSYHYLKRFSKEIANSLYSPSQSKVPVGHINGRISIMQKRVNELFELAPKKPNGDPDLGKWERTLLEAERNVAKEELSPEARQIREWLENFYETYIAGKDPSIKEAPNFFPRQLALWALQDTSRLFSLGKPNEGPAKRAALAGLLAEFNPDGPADLVTLDKDGNEINRVKGDWDKVVEALIREGEPNPDNIASAVSDIAIGMAEERAQYFKNIPNERLRDIEVLEESSWALRKYVEDMTKRLDYQDKVKTIVTRKDMLNAEGNPNLIFLEAEKKRITRLYEDLGYSKQDAQGKAANFPVSGWQAMEVMLNRIADPRDQDEARYVVKSMMGKVGLHMPSWFRSTQSALLAFNIMTYLTFATLASLPDLAGPVLRSKEMGALKTGLQQYKHYFNNKEEMRKFARDIGVISFDSLANMYINAAELSFMSKNARKLSNAFFKLTFLEAYTKFSRVFASGMGEQFLLRLSEKQDETANRHLEEFWGEGKAALARKDLKFYFSPENRRRFGTPEGERVRVALAQFVDESIVRPSGAERPAWASNPYTALVWQLKSFFYAYGVNIVGGAMRETKNRYSEDGSLPSAAIPLAIGAVTILPLTMIGLELREMLKFLMRGGDPSAFRSDNMGGGEYSLDIIDRAGILGPLGLILPMAEAHKFGQSWWVPPLGPTAQRTEQAFRGTLGWEENIPVLGAAW